MGNFLQGLTYPDVVALAVASGVKIGGGDWQKALLWGFGTRFVLNYAGFAQTPCSPQDTSFVGQAGSIFQRFMGAVGVGTQAQPAVVNPGPIIDAHYETVPQGQQVPTPGQ